MSLTGRVACLYQQHPVLPVDDIGTLPLTELTPLGGFRRVNLSNLRQSSGRLRIEDCPVGDDALLCRASGKLVREIRIETMLEVRHD